jgi:hypothetical protein
MGIEAPSNVVQVILICTTKHFAFACPQTVNFYMRAKTLFRKKVIVAKADTDGNGSLDYQEFKDLTICMVCVRARAPVYVPVRLHV